MQSINVYRIFAISTFLLFFAALITPVAEVTIAFVDADSPTYLEYICVYCQYGNIDSTGGDASYFIQRLTPFNFYNTWIINLLLIGLSLVSVIASYPQFNVKAITPKRAFYASFLLAGLGIVYRGLLQLLLWDTQTNYEAQYPGFKIYTDFSWGMGGALIGAILAATTGMICYIEFLYEQDTTVNTGKVAYYKNS